VFIWSIFSGLDIMEQEKSGNPAHGCKNGQSMGLIDEFMLLRAGAFVQREMFRTTGG
jgi:hypothetical protein